MSKYKVLLWDVDGTVLDFLAAERNAIRALYNKYGFGECTDEAISRYSAINVCYWQALERGEIEKPEMLVARFRDFFRSEGLDETTAEAFNADYQYALGDTIVYCENARELLEELRENYTLAAITNGTQTAQRRKLAASGLDRVFHGVFISEEVGAEKPNRVFFDAVFRTMEITELKDVLVIGDSLTSDIRGGSLAGVDTCWYNPLKKPGNPEILPTYEITRLDELKKILR